MRLSRRLRLPISFIALVPLCAVGTFAIGQSRVEPVGIIGFRDDTGGSASTEFLQKIAVGLQQELNKTYKDAVLARPMNAENDGTVEQLASVGKQDGMSFVVRGGLLTASGPTVQLFVDVISVEKGSVTALRAEGEATDADTALSTAIQRLAAAIHDLVVSTASVSTPAVAAPNDPSANAATASPDTDEELWQLVAQAEAVLASPSAVTTEALNSVRQSLDALNGALQSKASIVAEGKEPTEVDRLVAARKQELQAAVTTATEQAAAVAADSSSYQPPSEQKKSLLIALGERLAEATGILQQIQELQSAWAGAQDDQSAETGASATDQEVIEEPFEEITGVVTEEGEAVEGVTVTEPESGETATTDSDGSYVLRAVPGKLSRLVMTRHGKRLTTVPVLVQRGRPAVADLELKPTVNASRRPTLRILPSTVVVRRLERSGSTGRLEGVVRDSQGRPIPRALVNLRGVAVARTDSQGRYAFIAAPAGVHQLTVYRSGLKPQTSQVQVAARSTSRSGVDLAANETPVKRQQRPIVVSSGTSALLLGVVTGSERQPLAGAKVALLRQTGAVSVVTNGTGSYAFRGIEPGAYRAIVTKFGYGTETTSLELRSGRTETRNFSLRKSSTPGVLLPTIPSRPAPGTRTVPSISEREKPRTGAAGRTPEPAPLRAAAGGLRGQVVDAKTRKPVAGVTISASGARGTETNQTGNFALGNLPPGTYQIVVRRSGYADARANVTIRAGETVTLDLRLTPRPVMRRR